MGTITLRSSSSNNSNFSSWPKCSSNSRCCSTSSISSKWLLSSSNSNSSSSSSNSNSNRANKANPLRTAGLISK